MRRPRSGALEWIVPALVALITFVAFVPALRAGFVTWDDNRNFLDNPAYRGLGLAELRWMWTSFHMGHYVPLTWMTLGLDYELWGMDPAGYHLQNLVLHCANALLVYALARRLMQLAADRATLASSESTIAAAIGALLFAVHPLRVESVAWITERRDMLSLLFCLTSVLCYLRFATRGGTRWYGLSLVTFLAALLSKATAMSLPVVLLILDVYPLRRLGGAVGWTGATPGRVLGSLVPFGVLALGAAALSLAALHPGPQLSLGSKVAVSAYGVAFYLEKLVAPVRLAPLYEMPRQVDPLATRYLVSYAVFVVVTGYAWSVRRKWPAVTAAWAIFLVVLLPLLGIVQNGPQIVADRYTYHAAPSLAILAAVGFRRWHAPLGMRAGLSGAVLAVLAFLTWQQTGIWQTSERLWGRVLSVDSTSSIAQIAMGDLLASENRVVEASEHYARGVALDPTFAIGFNNLGVMLARQGRLGEADEAYEHAISLRPDYADAHNNWGIALSEQGDFAGAIMHFERAIEIDPTNADVEVNLGNALVRQGRVADALAHYERATTLEPTDATAYMNWGAALAQLGKLPDAIARLRTALSLEPDNSDVRAYLERAEAMDRAEHR